MDNKNGLLQEKVEYFSGKKRISVEAKKRIIAIAMAMVMSSFVGCDIKNNSDSKTVTKNTTDTSLSGDRKTFEKTVDFLNGEQCKCYRVGNFEIGVNYTGEKVNEVNSGYWIIEYWQNSLKYKTQTLLDKNKNVYCEIKYDENGKEISRLEKDENGNLIPVKVITISNKDAATGEGLPGAGIIIKNEKGEIVDNWVSDSIPHVIKNLSPGNYMLIETMAPEGYELSTETIEFTVEKDKHEKLDFVIESNRVKGKGGR